LSRIITTRFQLALSSFFCIWSTVSRAATAFSPVIS